MDKLKTGVCWGRERFVGGGGKGEEEPGLSTGCDMHQLGTLEKLLDLSVP